jgi:hypothetical protein
MSGLPVLVDHVKREPILDAAVRLVVHRNRVAYWRVIACPYCGARHDHGGFDPHRENPYALLGIRYGHCPGRRRDGRLRPIPELRAYRMIVADPAATAERISRVYGWTPEGRASR